jgi:hypothetical protein
VIKDAGHINCVMKHDFKAQIAAALGQNSPGR